MRKSFSIIAACVAVLGLALVGCGEKKDESGSEAIAKAKSMGTAQEQVDYLTGQAKAFMAAKEYKDAIDCANEALKLDGSSEEARSLLEKATSEWTAKAKDAAEGAQKDAEGAMEGAKENLGGLLKKSE